MYSNKLTTSSMSSYDFSSLTFFHEISCSTCYKFVISQQNCRMGPCKNKNSPNVNIQKMYKVQNKYLNPNPNFKLVR